MTFIFETGREINIFDKSYPLLAFVNSRHNEISVIIPMPKNYPDTKLKTAIEKSDNKSLITLEFSISKKNIHIDFFIVKMNMPQINSVSFPEERKPMKGLGKIVLCMIFSKYINVLFPSFTSEDTISLSAEPMVNRCDFMDVNEFTKHSISNLLKIIEPNDKYVINVFKHTFKSVMDSDTYYKILYSGDTSLLLKQLRDVSNIDKEYLISQVCLYSKFNQLVSYYKHYSFKQMEGNYFYHMYTTVGELINSCK